MSMFNLKGKEEISIKKVGFMNYEWSFAGIVYNHNKQPLSVLATGHTWFRIMAYRQVRKAINRASSLAKKNRIE